MNSNRLQYFSCCFAIFTSPVLITAAEPTAPEVSQSELLRLLVSKSELVVTGKFLGIAGPHIGPSGFATYPCEFKIQEVLKQNAKLQAAQIHVNIERVEREGDAKDKHPLLKKDSECILFLKKDPNTENWINVEYWFAIQPANPSMTDEIKDFSKQK
jgi:hypothetical protein